jgi:hypothetical protein
MALPFGRLLVCLNLWPLVLVHGTEITQQLHVVARHGSRFELNKEAYNLRENTPGTLTPFGQRQLYDLGVWVKKTYNFTGFFNAYVPWEIRLESSGFDRTLVSADSFALGAFDAKARDPTDENLLPLTPANIPVFSEDPVNDIYFRPHDKCDTFHDRLEDLYNSGEWQALEAQHASLLTNLAQLSSFQPDVDESGKIPLIRLWNVYDAIHVARTECVQFSSDGFSPTCQNLPNSTADALQLSEAEFQEVESLASLVENLRYGRQRAGRLIGGPLLSRILDRMAGEQAGNFFLYAG